MKIVELPLELCEQRVPSLAFLTSRDDALQVGFQVWLGNGSPTATPVACIIRLPAVVDDTLAVFVDGVVVKDDGLAYGADALEHDLFALAAAALVDIQPGDVVTIFTKDNFGARTITQPWTATLTFSDGSTKVVTGGVYSDNPAIYPTPTYVANGSFKLGWSAGTAATTYFLMGASSRFATPGVLVDEYPESAVTLENDDDNAGPLVHLNGIDTEVDEADAFRALANESLIFIGNEILTLAGATLVATNTYRLKVLRQRFGTRKASHATGAEVWMIARADLQVMTHPALRVGNDFSFKVASISTRFQSDLADVDPVAKQITGEPFVSSPRNLRIAGESPATIGAAAAMTATWSLPANIDASGEGDFTYATRVRFFVNDQLRDERTVNTAFVSYTLDDVVTILNGGSDFRLEIATLTENEEIQLASQAETLNGVAL